MADKRHAVRERYIERLLSEASDTNAALLRRFVQTKRAFGLKTTSLMNLTVSLSHLDAHAAGTRLEDLSPEALTAVLERFTRTHQPSSVTHFANHLRTFYKWLHDDELPKSYRLALKRQHKNYLKDVEVLTEPEFHSLLEAADSGPQRAAVVRRQAILWLLWDSGFRISEAMSLQLRDVRFDDRGGANLRLRPDAPDLKTGARTIYVVECVGPLKVWLEFHPDAGNPKAPLFPGHRNKAEPMWPANVATMLKAIGKRVGLERVHPHLFRHTRCTRAAEAGWNEPQMRAYFGWSRGSEMPSHYIHLSQRNMEARVRQDAGVDGLGQRITQPMTEGEVDAFLRRSLRRLLMEDA